MATRFLTLVHPAAANDRRQQARPRHVGGIGEASLRGMVIDGIFHDAAIRAAVADRICEMMPQDRERGSDAPVVGDAA